MKLIFWQGEKVVTGNLEWYMLCQRLSLGGRLPRGDFKLHLDSVAGSLEVKEKVGARGGVCCRGTYVFLLLAAPAPGVVAGVQHGLGVCPW